MSDEISTPTCGKCLWQRRAFGVKPSPLDHIKLNGKEYLGLHYCEHHQQPRGLVATNYACRNFERPQQIDGQLQKADPSHDQ